MPAHERWPEAEVQEVERLLHQGLSASLIGKRLGRSRSSILGLVHRRKLRRGDPAPLIPPAKRGAAVEPKPAPPPTLPPTAALAVGLGAPKTYDHVRQKLTCTFMVGRSPIGEGLYCCAPTHGQRYCLFHKRVMFRVGPP